ncbi:hypothetical protein MNBD_GAMMA15-2376 [hydrothermal vent metagenome]|uniref:MobA-like NTP transferase domain-containing protein n=1 Tax=hydrothermal vent metagenome TaxID=652676 RepID=A0A3B0ZIN8_9ZZZZ
MSNNSFTAIILAADRSRDDPLIQDAGVCAKALVEINGRPMVGRVVDALSRSQQVSDIVLSGPAKTCFESSEVLMEIINKGTARWSEPADSPASSAYAALKQLPEHQSALVTTADHPLLRPDIIDDFLERALASGADVVAGVTTIKAIHEKFPGARKTVMRFSDDGYCGCNLFAFMTPQSHRVAKAWRSVEKQRKNPLYIIRQLGLGSVLRYGLGMLRMETAAGRLSQKLGVNIKPVLLPFPEAAIDVDTVADQHFVETILGTDK